VKKTTTTSSFVVAATLALPASVAASPNDGECPPAVALEGDARATSAIEAALHAHAVDGPRTSCPTVYASIEQVAKGLRVTITDIDGRRTERIVSDAATAATWIESFAMIDPAPAYTTPPAVAALRDPEQPAVVVVRTRDDDPRPRGAIGVAMEGSFASDGSLWYGFRARGCVQLGAACVGGEARFSRDANTSGDSYEMGTSRSGADVMLVVGLPLTHDGTRVTPGIAAGIGWLHATGRAEEGGGMVDADTGGIRTSLHLDIAVPLTRKVAVTLGASLDYAPFARSTNVEAALAAEPPVFARLVVGLELVPR
jgi:hypothetical protein